jgi:hypothetical protein
VSKCTLQKFFTGIEFAETKIILHTKCPCRGPPRRRCVETSDDALNPARP